MAVRTARNFIERSLRIIRATEVGETPDSEEASDALNLFNDMLDLWSTQSLSIPYTASAEYSLTANKKIYSIGPGGDFDGLRPVNLRTALLRIGGNLDIPITILQQYEYEAIPQKSITSPQPTSLYYEAQFPLGFITMYPVPQVAVDVVLSYDAMFANLTLNSDLNGLPPGYAMAIQYQLAMYLAQEYGKTMTPQAIKIAQDSFGSLKSANLKARDAIVDGSIPGVDRRGWDWRIG